MHNWLQPQRRKLIQSQQASNPPNPSIHMYYISNAFVNNYIYSNRTLHLNISSKSQFTKLRTLFRTIRRSTDCSNPPFVPLLEKKKTNLIDNKRANNRTLIHHRQTKEDAWKAKFHENAREREEGGGKSITTGAKEKTREIRWRMGSPNDEMTRRRRRGWPNESGNK